MSILRSGIGRLALFVIVAACVSPTSAQKSALQGGIDVERQCRETTGTGATVGDMGDAYSWKCGNGAGVSMDDACVRQYGPRYRSRMASRSDAYSWSCVAMAPPPPGLAIDVERQCRETTGTRAVLGNRADAYSWRCGNGVGLSMNDACRRQHGPQTRAFFRSRRDAYSWYCAAR